MRLIVLLGLFLSFALTGKAQFNSSELKYAIIMGGQIRMASDNIDRTEKVGAILKSSTTRLDLLNRADYLMITNRSQAAIRVYQDVLESYIASDNTGSQPMSVFTRSERKDKRQTYAEKLAQDIVKQEELTKDDWFLIARTLNAIGIYYHQQGNLSVAEKLYSYAMELRAEYGSKTSEHYVNSLHNLAVLRKNQGRYNAAEDMLLYVVRFLKAKQGIESYQYAIARNNQAMLYAEIGRTDESLDILTEIVSNSTATQYSPSSVDLSRIITNQALVNLEEGKLDLAVELMQSAVAGYDIEKRNKNADLLLIDLYLNKLYITQNAVINIVLIEELCEQIRKEFGAESLIYSEALTIQGDAFFSQNEFDLGLAAYDKAEAILLNQVGELHLDHLNIVMKQGLTYWKMNQIENSYARLLSATNGYLLVIDRFFYNMSEREKFKFWQAIQPQINTLFAFAMANKNSLPESITKAFEVRTRTKGLLLYNTNAVIEQIDKLEDPILLAKYQQWVALKMSLSNYYSVTEEALKEMDIDLQLLETEANSLEKEINLAVAGGINKSIGVVAPSALSDRLEPSEAVVELIRIKNPINKQEYYGAWILTKEELTFERIGEAIDLETKFIKYYKNAIKLKRADNLSYKYFWEVIGTKTKMYNKLFVSLDGVYNLINISSLADDGVYIIDNQEIELIPNVGAIMTLENNTETPDNAILVGNPTFSSPAISALPGTAIELLKIGRLLNDNNVATAKFTQDKATEEVLKKIDNPSIVHIATHGFFLGKNPSKEAILAGNSITIENPLLKSGLLFAGAGNETNQSDALTEGDGVFTAYDGMSLPLLKTDLVVLSACETGGGEVVNGEGVYGLSRAFSVAGASHVVISLWKVDDTATQELMTAFYRLWFSGEDIKIAFLNAQKAIKAKYPDPYYWAAFIMLNNN